MMKEPSFVNKCLEKKIFCSIDIFFAKTLLDNQAADSSLFFLSYLFLATRLGHHCITLNPPLVSPYLMSDQDFDKKEIMKILQEGASQLSDRFVQKASHRLNLKPVVKFKESFYLQKYFFLETQFIKNIKKFIGSESSIFSPHEIEAKLSLFSKNLSEEQENAIRGILQHRLSFLTGGPGTGKTYTAAYLLKIWEELFFTRNIQPKIALAAPTGKAALKLKESLKRSRLLKDIEAYTLHQLLDIKSKQDCYNPKPTLNYDIILIDESSMIDLELFTAFFRLVDRKTSVVLIGDPYQLPPVESGTIFAELALFEGQKPFHIAKLKTPLRTDRQELITLAQKVVSRKKIDINKDKKNVLSFFQASHFHDMTALLEQEINRLCEQSWFKPLPKDRDDESLFLLLSSHKLLTPFIDGVWGVNQVNARCFNAQLYYAQKGQRYALPLIVTKNDYDLGLYNGLEGIYIKHIEDNKKSSSYLDYVIFQTSQGLITWPLNRLKSYSLSYALSVHKSQGSEYEKVSLFLPKGSEKFGVEMLYTALTRAKKSLKIFTQEVFLEQFYQQNTLKESCLSCRFFGSTT